MSGLYAGTHLEWVAFFNFHFTRDLETGNTYIKYSMNQYFVQKKLFHD